MKICTVRQEGISRSLRLVEISYTNFLLQFNFQFCVDLEFYSHSSFSKTNLFSCEEKQTVFAVANVKSVELHRLICILEGSIAWCIVLKFSLFAYQPYLPYRSGILFFTSSICDVNLNIHFYLICLGLICQSQFSLAQITKMT